MEKKYKYRHELKYVISKKDALILQKQLGYFMEIDKNSLDDNTYLIKSLYFDDLDSTSYYEKLDGVLYRKKFRIRIYNNDDSYIKLEKKMKHNNLTAKESCLISKETYSKIINGNIDDIKADDELLLEFKKHYKYDKLVPSIIVEYKRLAYTYPISDVRITFDEDLKSGRYNEDLFNHDLNYEVFDLNKLVLEVKFNEILPSHIASILSTIPMCRQAVSKFAICRSIK